MSQRALAVQFAGRNDHKPLFVSGFEATCGTTMTTYRGGTGYAAGMKPLIE
jgi:hypothetical protein